MGSPPRSVVARLKAIQAWDRYRLRALGRRHPGLHIHPTASSNLAAAQFDLAPGAELRIGARVTTERRPMALRFLVAEGARVEIEEDTWLRTEVDRVVVSAGPGARIQVGPEGFLNGCHLSAKVSITLGRHAWVGFGSRLIDGDQHDLDEARPERSEPIEIGDYAWVAGDVTVLRGVSIGAHSVIGARSLVNRSVPPHTLAFGTPAVPRGDVGDRSGTR
jgi:carbonic anhydrase/acetyltransferase-like protein (isoleucine patch superfamily)